MTDPDLARLLVEHRERLVRFLQKHAGRLLRYETVEDLAQGIHLRALDRGGTFRFEGEDRFLGWLFTLARSYVADRRIHWGALKRQSGRLLRITQSPEATSDPRAVGEPVRQTTGPATFADRREMVTVAVKALAALLPRDRQLMGWHTEGPSRWPAEPPTARW